MIYVHVPFCRSFCTYCDFYSEICSRDASQQVQNRVFEQYENHLSTEIHSRAKEIVSGREPSNIDTLYFGGGTPSILPLSVLKKIVDTIIEVSGSEGCFREFTLEVNPDDIVHNGVDYVIALKEMGVNRISMGLQSFDNGILKWMNRRHSAEDAISAVRILREGGIDNISIDLIFGLSQLSADQWKECVKQAIALDVQHISAYQLSIEEGSALGRMVRNGSYVEASDEQCREQYESLCKLLSESGYNHYEISNWGKPGFEAMHNSAYWRRVPYVGLGPGAHSLSCDNQRSWNSESLSGWTSESETLGTKEVAEETVMLALRTSTGIRESLLRSCADGTVVDRLLSEGVIIRNESSPDDFIRIPENHFFVSDDIISSLF